MTALAAIPDLARIVGIEQLQAILTALQENIDLIPQNAPDGTVDLPGMAFAGQQGTGISRGSDGSVTISQNGKAVLTISKDGTIDFLCLTAGGSVSLDLSKRMGLAVYAQDLGATGDGATDDSISLMSRVVSSIFLPPAEYYIGQSCTISAQLIFAPGAVLKIGPDATVTLSKNVDVPDEQIVFSLSDVATSKAVIPNQRVSLGWFDIAGDGTQDVGPTMNSIIAGSSANGRAIYIPPGRSYLINTTIDLQGMNYLTIYGDGRGERSNLDYTLAEPQGPGLANSVVWPGGGPRFVLGPTVTIGISSPLPDASEFPRITGINLRGFMVVGNRDATVDQTGIALERNSDTTNIIDVGIINFQTTTGSIGLALWNADTPVIRGIWCAEVSNPIKIYGSNDVLITSCSLGGKIGGPTLGLDTVRRLTFTGNTIYPDGEQCISMLNCLNCVITGNTITSRFTGMITLYGSYGNIFSDNFIRNPADTGTTWITSDKGSWSTQNYDPAGRDELFGMIYLDPTSNDNVIQDNQIWSWMDNVAACGIRIKSGAGGNRIVNNKFMGSAAFIGSANLVVVEGAPAGDLTYVLDTCLSTQATVGGSVVARYLTTS